MYLAPRNVDNFEEMSMKRIVLILICMVAIASCRKDDSIIEQGTPPRLLADQTTVDDTAIKEYLNTHFYNYEEFENPPAGFDFKIRVDTLAGDNIGMRPLMDDITSEIVTISSGFFGLPAEETDVPHTLYYLTTDTGVGAKPTVADSVYVKYEGFRLDGTIFDSNTGAPVWFDLQGIPQVVGGSIKGFKKGISNIKSGGDIITNDDGTFEVQDVGVGLILMPSGLAYFNGAQPGESYAPIIFNVELLVANTADHENDGVPSFAEDLDGDENFFNDDTDGDSTPNYIDSDDDGDGTLTIDEDLEPDTDLTVDRDGDGDPENDIGDGNPLNDDTDGDGIPNYLDTDDTASRKDTN